MTDTAPGFLRLLVVFHESESLGAGRAVLGTMPRLREYGWSPSAWVPGEGPIVAQAEGLADECVVVRKPIAYSVRGWRAGEGVRTRAADTSPYLRRLRAELIRLRPHVVHANTLRTLPEAAVAHSLGLPVVLQVHELPEPGPKRLLALRWAAHVADVIVAVSAAVAEMVRPHAGDTPLLIARNGVPELPRVVRAPEPGLVGTIGTICRAKGTDVFLEAAALARARRPGLRFEHVGQAGLDVDHAFERNVSALADAASVQMLGRQPAADAIGRWETFVLPSRTDAFPLASLEAMSVGLPVIASSVGGLPEQIVHLESGILGPPERPDIVADWIVRLADEPELRERLGRNAVERVHLHFDRNRQADALHRAYLTALNVRYAPPPVKRAMLAAL